MRRRRGETSLFEILSEPKSDQEPKEIRVPAEPPKDPLARPKKKPPELKVAPGGTRKKPRTTDRGSVNRGFWPTAKGLGSTSEEKIDPAVRQPARTEPPRTEPRAAPTAREETQVARGETQAARDARLGQPVLPTRDRPGGWRSVVGSPVPTDEAETAVVVEPDPEPAGVGDSPMTRLRERLRELPEVERAPQESSGDIWSFLNRAVEVRYATITLFAMAVLLVGAAAYLTGKNRTDEVGERFAAHQSWDDSPPYAPDPTLTPKRPLREIRSETGGPKAAEQRKAQGAGGTGSSKHEKSTPPSTGKRFGISVCTTNRSGADNLLEYLRTFEDELGLPAGVVPKGGQLMVYVGEFGTVGEAEQHIEKVRRLKSAFRVDFRGATIMPLPKRQGP